MRNFTLQAVAFDLDDTLLHDDLTVSDYTVATMRRAAAAGVLVLPASGRTFPSMKGTVERLGCAKLCIACNGAEVWQPGGTAPLMARNFTPELTQAVLAFGRRHGVYMQTYHGDRFFYSEAGHYAEAYAKSSTLAGVLTPELEAFVQGKDISKVLMMADEGLIAQMLAEATEQFRGQLSVTCSKPYFIEFNPLHATKGDALRWCAERLGFDLAHTAAFGDSLNDLSMLTAAGLGVAVANARPDVLPRVATHCASNNDDGPARLVAQLLTEREASA